MKHLHLLLIILTSLVLIACNSYESEEHKPSKGESIVSGYSTSCFAEDCNPSIAVQVNYARTETEYLYGYEFTKNFWSQCNSWVAGTIEGKTVMATNRHCVENHDSSAILNCEGYVSVKFLEFDNYGPVSANCSRILSNSDFEVKGGEFKLVQDYVFYLLDRFVDRPIIEINQIKASDGLEVQIDSIDFEEGSMQVGFKSQTCPVIRDTFVNLYSVDDYGPVWYAHGCDIKEGNSGSVVLNQGQAVGFLYGSHYLKEKNPNKYLYIDSENRKGIGAYLVNMACVDFPLLGINKNPQCVDAVDEFYSVSEKKAIERVKQKAVGSFKQQVYERIISWTEEAKGFFGWNLDDKVNSGAFDLNIVSSDKATKKFYTVPACIKISKFDKWVEDQYAQGPVDPKAKRIIKIYQAPKFKYSTRINDNYTQEYIVDAGSEDLYIALALEDQIALNSGENITVFVHRGSEPEPSDYEKGGVYKLNYCSDKDSKDYF